MTEERTRTRNVVVATDFSTGAASAVARAALLPLAPDARISLVHVLPEGIPARYAAAAHDGAAAALRESAEELRRAAGGPGVAAPRVETALLAGDPHVEIIRHARSRAADLIVLGRHGPGALRGSLMGTTAERVIRKGDVPVLLVKEAPTAPYRRAVVAADLSDATRRGVDLALALVPDDVRELTLVHACHVAYRSWLGDAALAEWRRELSERATACAKDLVAAVGGGRVEYHVVVREGDPRVEVLDEAVRSGADLVVAGTHARSGVAHALLGSVAEWLVRSAPCDVAVTRPARFTFELP